MIVAQKSAWFSAWFSSHALGRMRTHFSLVRARGVEALAAAAARGPVLVVANHTAYWDALVILALTRRTGVDGFALMDAKNLRRLPFFAKVGAFGVDLDDPRDGARALRYAARLLDRPGRVVFVFAQGEERPSHEPLRFRAGAAQLARVAKRAVVLPLAMRYEHRSAEKPELWLSFGDAVATRGDGEGDRSSQEAAVARELSRIDAALAAQAAEEFDVWMRSEPSALARLAERALAWLCRGALRGAHDRASRGAPPETPGEGGSITSKS